MSVAARLRVNGPFIPCIWGVSVEGKEEGEEEEGCGIVRGESVGYEVG